MKIAIDYQIFFIQKFGGISRYFCKLAEICNEKGYNIRIFAPFHRNEFLKTCTNTIVKGKYFYKYPYKLGLLIKMANWIVCKQDVINWKPDIIHESYYPRFPLATKRMQSVVTVHDMIHEIYPEMFSVNDRVREFKKNAVKRAAHIICPSNNTRNDLIRLLNVKSKDISVIYHGVDTANGNRMDPEKQTQNEKPYLLFVGDRDGYKNFSGLITAISLSEKIQNKFHLIAFGGPDFSKEEKAAFSGNGLQKMEITHIRGDDTVLSSLYSRASGFIYPSKYEGFGLPVLEAMRNGCPVICSYSSSLPEVAGYACEYFNPEQPNEMALKMEKVLFNEDLKKEMVAKGFSQIAKFTWEQCVKETLSVYMNVL